MGGAADEHKCAKEYEFGEISTTLRFFQDAEMRREKRDEKMLETMETIAAQGATIQSHAETLARHDKSHREAFSRIRSLESPIGRLFMGKKGPYILAVLVAGFLVGLGSNYEAVAKLAVKVVFG